MIPLQCLAAEEENGEEREDYKCDNLLDNLELHQRKRASIADKTDAVSRNLAGILRQGNSPRKDNNGVEGP